jgi:RNA polymerase sigma-70 factor (ECF subfamily)
MTDRSVPGDTAPPAGPAASAPGAEVAAEPGLPSRPATRGGDPPLGASQLERVRARDPEALAAFFERYVDRVYGLVYRLLGDRTLAEDMTQEVFLKVHRAADRIDPSRDPAPWLMTIAHNACRDLWRSNAWKLSRRAASLDGDSPLAETLSRGTNDPERDLLAGERERLVQEALLRLPEPLRVAIVLHDYQGMGHDEIAAVTGIHHAAARKRYSRALAALGRLLRDALG